MVGTQSKKTDRRSLYSQAVIKDALLKLLGEKDYGSITVSDLCRAAEINRGTFYLHSGNIGQVLDALFDDALGSLHGVLEQVGIPAAGEDKCAYPLCHFLRENKKYRALFFSDSLHSQVIRRLTQAGEDGFVRRLHPLKPPRRSCVPCSFFRSTAAWPSVKTAFPALTNSGARSSAAWTAS